ncbi:MULTISPECIES: Na+/H+ antiporter family protein [unclassified Moraxella]|uniref:Na+/H+ antiporter family protein n=1 Tax=unclassified Moraxella TaxID=2685852 RepID=UPI002B407645|nr:MULTISPECIES: Na+/H+ antiporter NhaC family protein [unclassified Moraxella]
MNAVLIAVVIMVGLSLARVHVVLSLIIGAVIGGLMAGLSIADTLTAFHHGLSNGAQIALSYAILGAFAMAIAHSGVPKLLVDAMTARLNQAQASGAIKWTLFALILVMAMLSQNLIPIHIGFIPLIIPSLLLLFNRLQVDRRLVACIITFGLVNTYMFIPYGFGDIFLNQIILKNINDAGMNTSGVSIMQVMAIPAAGMLFGVLMAVFVSYRKPRVYQNLSIQTNHAQDNHTDKSPAYRLVVVLSAIVAAFIVHFYTDSLLMGSMVGFLIFIVSGVVSWHEADGVFNDGIKMMAMIGFIMISAQGFAEVMKATGQIDMLVSMTMEIFGGSKGVAAFVMLMIGLIVTLGIGSSFSTVPILAAIYVPMCVALDFSVPATIALVATSGVLGDAGSPASDSTLGPTMGLDIDGQHDHIKDSVIPTFIHYNIPLVIFGWIAAMVL